LTEYLRKVFADL